MARLDQLDSHCQASPEHFYRLARSAQASHLPRWPLLGLLLAVCLVPRCVAAWRWDIIWGDTLSYLFAAEALEAGDLEGAFRDFGLNVYPAVLCLLRRLTSDWQTAAKWLSVGAATATVLPLFGWLRRQLDDRLAIIGCLCYAFHGKLVAVSPLAIRDPIFWLFVAATMYWAWRAAAEVRIAAFVAAGAAFTLAVHTRTEGWVLLAPIVLWPAISFATAGPQRLRLVLGTALCLAVMPAARGALNLTVLRGYPQWQIIPARHVALARDWAAGRTPLAPAAGSAESASGSAEASSAAGSPMAAAWDWMVGRLVITRKVLVRTVKGFTYVGVLLTLTGMVTWRRLLARPENLATWLMCLAMMGMIWVRYQQAGLDIRYFLPVVMLLVGWMALGYASLETGVLRMLGVGWADSEGEQPSAARRRRLIALAALAGALAAGSLAEAKLAAAKIMRRQIVLGQWIAEVLGPNQRIAGGPENLILLSWYAQGTVVRHFDPQQLAGHGGGASLAGEEADVVVLLISDTDEASCRQVASQLAQQPKARYTLVPSTLLPPASYRTCLLVRAEKFPLIEAAQPTTGAHRR